MKTTPVISDRALSHVTSRRTQLGAPPLWLLVVGLIAGGGFILPGATVTLAWDPVTHDVGGFALQWQPSYRIHYGTASGVYTAHTDVAATTGTVAGLPPAVTHFFAVTAVDPAGQESAFSEERAWAASYHLALGVHGAGTVDLASGWYASGTSLIVTATAAADWVFTYWTGDTSGCTSAGSTLVVPVDAPRAITVAFRASSGDSDDDGVPDPSEYLAGTDPYDPTSVLEMNPPSQPVRVEEGGLVIEWTSVTGKYYAVERGTNLLADPAFTATAWHIPGQSPVTAYTDTTATASGLYYYRIRVEP